MVGYDYAIIVVYHQYSQYGIEIRLGFNSTIIHPQLLVVDRDYMRFEVDFDSLENYFDDREEGN